VPLTQNSNRANAPARWSVFYRRNGKQKRRKFGTEFDEALKFYTTVPNATLHCDNVSFYPPERLTHHEHTTWTVATVKGKRYKRRVTKTVNLLREYNHKGIWWCCYCVKLRRFKEITTERGVEMCCPVCWVSSYEGATRHANPMATIIEQHRTRRRTGGTRRRRK